ncbi:MAG: permease-like cell division protein FtsX, partial [Gammaproteobacteria bacterium]
MNRRTESRPANGGARRSGPGIGGFLRTYLVRHVQMFVLTLGRLYRHPGGTLMTVAVIGIALALPAGLQALISNTRSLSGAWEGAARISVYLKQDQSTAAARALADELKRRDDVADVRVISPDQAMNEFRRLSGFGDALKVLDSNPLPAVLVVQPADAYAPPAVLQRMVDGIGEDQRVDMVQLDAQWLRRLHAILEI